MRFWPSGWVCQAVRAPGSNVTLAPCTRAGSGASNKGAKRTVPVKYSVGPLPEVWEPPRLMSILLYSSRLIVWSLIDALRGLLRRPFSHHYFRSLFQVSFEHLTIIVDLGSHACLT